MRVSEIIAEYVGPGTTIVDLTTGGSRLIEQFDAAGRSDIVSVQTLAGGEAASGRVLVVQSLPASGSGRPRLEMGVAARRTVNLIFVDRIETLIEGSVLEEATAADWQVAAAHVCEHPAFSFAIALRMRTQPPLEQRADDHELKTINELQRQLETTHKKMVAARTSVSFRIGRATKLALESKPLSPLAVPRRWLEAFRERSAIPPGLAPLEPRSGIAARPRQAAASAEGRELVLLGLAPPPGNGPIVATIAGEPLQTELAACARCQPLPPGSWRDVLEAERPALVLVTADGLDDATAWGRYGTTGASGGRQLLPDLTEHCRKAGIPTVFWDTLGAPRPRLGIPVGAYFDLVFTVSPRCTAAAPAAELPEPQWLGCAVEPSIYNPIAPPSATARNPVYAGIFDRRVAREELETLEHLLREAAARGLVIYDSHFRYAGPLAETISFPAGLREQCAQRPALHEESRALKAAGIQICGNASETPDFVGWTHLRAIGLGLHVLATPDHATDPEISNHIHRASNPEEARTALDELLTRPLRDSRWATALRRVFSTYSLRDRLDQIASACGVAPVARPEPRIAIAASVRTASELDALCAFLEAQTVAPTAAALFTDTSLDPSALADRIPQERLFIHAGGRSRPSALSELPATHVLLWRLGMHSSPETVAELSRMARMSNAELLAIAPSNVVCYAHGSIGDDDAIAVRTDSAGGDSSSWLGADAIQTSRTLLAEGARALTRGRLQ